MSVAKTSNTINSYRKEPITVKKVKQNVNLNIVKMYFYSNLTNKTTNNILKINTKLNSTYETNDAIKTVIPSQHFVFPYSMFSKYKKTYNNPKCYLFQLYKTNITTFLNFIPNSNLKLYKKL